MWTSWRNHTQMKPKMLLIEFLKFILVKICDYAENWPKKIRNLWLSWTKTQIFAMNSEKMKLIIPYFSVCAFVYRFTDPWLYHFRFDSAGLDSSFGRSIFWSLLRAKDFYSRNYQESFKIRILNKKLIFGLEHLENVQKNFSNGK